MCSYAGTISLQPGIGINSKHVVEKTANHKLAPVLVAS